MGEPVLPRLLISGLDRTADAGTSPLASPHTILHSVHPSRLSPTELFETAVSWLTDLSARTLCDTLVEVQEALLLGRGLEGTADLYLITDRLFERLEEFEKGGAPARGAELIELLQPWRPTFVRLERFLSSGAVCEDQIVELGDDRAQVADFVEHTCARFTRLAVYMRALTKILGSA